MSKREKKKKLEPKTDGAKPDMEEKPEEVEPTAEEKPEEEEKPVKVKKEVQEEKPKKKGKKARLSTLYDYDYEKNIIKMKNKKCPRCGNIMALHKSPTQRWACGSCSYTEYVKKEENELL
jgi:small subunit ribosomal protein S27Ae